MNTQQESTCRNPIGSLTWNRRDFLKTVAAAAGATVIPSFGWAAGSSTQAPNGKPWNVLLVAIDDLNDYPTILRNYPGMKTPNMDKLAASSVRFSRAFCPGTACMPSRTAIMSGLAPWRSGVFKNGQKWENTPELMAIKPLPQVFRESGRYTMTRGKIFHESSRTMPHVYERMWDDPGEWGSYAPKPKPNPRESLDISEVFGYGVATESEIADFRLVAETEQLLARSYDKPFFLAHGIFYPHVPLTVPRRFLDLYPEDEIAFPPPGYKEDDLDDVPEAGKKDNLMRQRFAKLKDAGLWKTYLRHYLAAISAADELLGRVMTALDKSPHKDNTIVVVWADHGLHVGEKSRLAKFMVWDQTAHVTFLVRAPGMTKPGATCERVVSLQDIYPTLVELCGLQEPGHELSGRSIVPLLKNPSAPWPHPAVTYHTPSIQGIRTERFRYITYGRDQEELYDHDNDPNEWTNLAGKPEYAKAKADLAAALKAAMGRQKGRS